MAAQQFQFEWDDAKAASNWRKHRVEFELASTIFSDPRILTIADTEHSDLEERWFSVGLAINGALLSVSYLWKVTGSGPVKVRLISARHASTEEISYYTENR